ncbi:cytochrome c [uncultured Roseobacter sp.]|uniref:cytochrome c n=1 Tax=uncultured Roseobacter sp. TaxID=114847 RepID=UPI00262E473D|nr:cytochrome c [uncultured Roseobacter sp.]
MPQGLSRSQELIAAMRLVTGLALAACAAGLVFWGVTTPDRTPPDFAGTSAGDVEAGALVFAAGGCASCHKAPDAGAENKLVLAGGHAFPSDFGTFYAPNISPDQQAGIGQWTKDEFAVALTKGVSPEGAHYYPAFPYAAYSKMTAQDVVDLFAYMKTLPTAQTPSREHDVGFPFSIRRTLGVWKHLFVSDDYHITGTLSPEVERGRYLAEALTHCTECHTERNALGGLNTGRWLAGAPNPSGKGRIPNITPSDLDWSEADLVAYFTSGFTPDYDSAGGEMAEVIENLALLPAEDRAALAAYLQAVPAIP